jgi:hypothetical protein
LKYSKLREFVHLAHLANASHARQTTNAKQNVSTFQIEITGMIPNSIILHLFIASNLNCLAIIGLCKSLEKYRHQIARSKYLMYPRLRYSTRNRIKQPYLSPLYISFYCAHFEHLKNDFVRSRQYFRIPQRWE